MSDEEGPENVVEMVEPKNGWPAHKMAPWPDHVKVLIEGLWINGLPPLKIAERINEMGVLSKPIHANTISQYMSTLRKKKPEILQARTENIQEFKEAAVEAAGQIKENILGRIKESTMIVTSEVTDKLPNVIRNFLSHLENASEDDDPKIAREWVMSLKMATDILSKFGGLDVANRILEHRGKKLVDLEFDGPPEDGPKNVTPAVVEIEGWDPGERT